MADVSYRPLSRRLHGAIVRPVWSHVLYNLPPEPYVAPLYVGCLVWVRPWVRRGALEGPLPRAILAGWVRTRGLPWSLGPVWVRRWGLEFWALDRRTRALCLGALGAWAHNLSRIRFYAPGPYNTWEYLAMLRHKLTGGGEELCRGAVFARLLVSGCPSRGAGWGRGLGSWGRSAPLWAALAGLVPPRSPWSWLGGVQRACLGAEGGFWLGAWAGLGLLVTFLGLFKALMGAVCALCLYVGARSRAMLIGPGPRLGLAASGRLVYLGLALLALSLVWAYALPELPFPVRITDVSVFGWHCARWLVRATTLTLFLAPLCWGLVLIPGALAPLSWVSWAAQGSLGGAWGI